MTCLCFGQACTIKAIMYRKKIDEVLSQELTRTEFLKVAGGIGLTLLGLPTIINPVTKAFTHEKKATTKKMLSSSGYGSRPYGE